MKADAVQVRMRCNGLNQTQSWQKNADGSSRIQTKIDLHVQHTNDPTDPNYPYAQLSGGTTFPLTTINEAAAAMFELGKDYMITITPCE